MSTTKILDLESMMSADAHEMEIIPLRRDSLLFGFIFEEQILHMKCWDLTFDLGGFFDREDCFVMVGFVDDS
jgi:hypothetical protein